MPFQGSLRPGGTYGGTPVEGGDGEVIQGPAGPRGSRGPRGHVQYTGNGPPPAVITGAEVGETYVDLTTGIIYELR